MKPSFSAAEVVLPCAELQPTLGFFKTELGFRMDTIYPADNPRAASMSGYGVRVSLEQREGGDPGVLRLVLAEGEAPRVPLTAPNGTRVEFIDAADQLHIPPVQNDWVLSRLDENTQWGVGRAGMRYRDLIPSRLGGYLIASHIHIAGGGPVPDHEHYHKVRFQMIYCYKGWVRLVYEDQGEPFILKAGDCVLQPPEIRHRVLESSGDPDLEVIELGCPAEHLTTLDYALSLPTGVETPERDFSGQRFVRHIAEQATYAPWRVSGLEARDIGFTEATDGVASAKVARVCGGLSSQAMSHNAEALFWFVLQGKLGLSREEQTELTLQAGDSLVVPPNEWHRITHCSADLELLEVTLPARFDTQWR